MNTLFWPSYPSISLVNILWLSECPWPNVTNDCSKKRSSWCFSIHCGIGIGTAAFNSTASQLRNVLHLYFCKRSFRFLLQVILQYSADPWEVRKQMLVRRRRKNWSESGRCLFYLVFRVRVFEHFIITIIILSHKTSVHRFPLETSSCLFWKRGTAVLSWLSVHLVGRCSAALALARSPFDNFSAPMAIYLFAVL